MEPIVRVENLSKKYSRNANAHLSYGIRDLFSEIVGREKGLALRKDEFLAVDNVSFDLKPGDSFALVGRNGSGKTTILKMMNGLTKPDGGRIVMKGRVQALINLGAGFSPQLPGRDNVYNSASLMGLTHRETTDILEEIIDFAELGEFIDSPVGTYSSGMKARLGFAVAVHLYPDILLIDEILAVGDFAFQNKCYTKMEELKKSGVTIVLVSHSHPKVIQLCERAIWMHAGKTMHIGPAKETVKAYMEFLERIEQDKVEEANRKREAEAERKQEPKKVPPPAPVSNKPPDDPNLKVAITEPKVNEPEMFLSAKQEGFELKGWYTASTEKPVEVHIDGSVLNAKEVKRPDVEALYPDVPVAKGFHAVIRRDVLKSTNQVALWVGGVVYWSKSVVVESRGDGEKHKARSGTGLYGPVYHTEGRVEGVDCALYIDGAELNVIPIHSELTIRYQFQLLKEVQNLHMTLNIFSKDGFLVAAIASLQEGLHQHIHGGTVRGEIQIPDFDLTPGTYVIMMPICEGKSYLFRDVVKEFAVDGGGDMYWGVKEFKCEHLVFND